MRTLKCTKNDPWVGSRKLTRMSLPLFHTSSKDTKKFYIWFRFPSQVADILDTKNETGQQTVILFVLKVNKSVRASWIELRRR